MRAVVRQARRGGLAGLLSRRRPAPDGPEATLGTAFFAVLARAPEGWTRTLDVLRAPGDVVVFGRLEARMASTELSRIAPYAETADEAAEFAAFRTLVDACAHDDTREIVLTPA